MMNVARYVANFLLRLSTKKEKGEAGLEQSSINTRIIHYPSKKFRSGKLASMDSYILDCYYRFPWLKPYMQDLPKLLKWEMPNEVIIVDNTKEEPKRVFLRLQE